jgi:hypothetical protein
VRHGVVVHLGDGGAELAVVDPDGAAAARELVVDVGRERAVAEAGEAVEGVAVVALEIGELRRGGHGEEVEAAVVERDRQRMHARPASGRIVATTASVKARSKSSAGPAISGASRANSPQRSTGTF